MQLLDRPGGKERPRSRVLSGEELKGFLQNLDYACRFQRLPARASVILLTVQRPCEVALAEWREFDFNGEDLDDPACTCEDRHRGHVLALSDRAIGRTLRSSRSWRAGPSTCSRTAGPLRADPS